MVVVAVVVVLNGDGGRRMAVCKAKVNPSLIGRGAVHKRRALLERPQVLRLRPCKSGCFDLLLVLWRGKVRFFALRVLEAAFSKRAFSSSVKF